MMYHRCVLEKYPQIEIQDIKNRLPILDMLSHYGLKPDRNDRLKCPFHPSKTPSLEVYPKTNTY
jgi:DNA primase